jgi:hemerythrin
MSIFAWKDTYSIGVPEIDTQHRRLFSLADELYSAMNNGKGKPLVEKVLKNLIDYTKTHFAAEEQLMQRCKYPDYKPHKLKHDELTKQVLQLQRDFEEGKTALTIEVMQFLSTWLRQHIGGTDKRYVPYLMGKTAA